MASLRGRLVFSSEKASKGIERMDFSADMKWICICILRSIVFVDPFTLEISQIMEVLSSPAVYLKVNDTLNHLIVACSDKSIRIYHTVSYSLLQQTMDRSEYSPNSLSTAFYVPPICRFYSAGDRVLSWKVEKISVDEVEAHQLRLFEPFRDPGESSDIACMLLAKSTDQVIVLERAGVVRTYTAVNGDLVGYFSMLEKLHEGKHWVALVEGFDFECLKSLQVHLACLDSGDRRLFVCTQENVVIAWNYLSGECLHLFCPILSMEGSFQHLQQNQKLHDMTYVQIEDHENIRYLLLSFGGTVQCHREIDDFKRTATKHLAIPSAKDSKASSEPEVVWMRVWRTSLVVAYSDGSLIRWELLHQTKDGSNFSQLTTSVKSFNRRHVRNDRVDRIRSMASEALEDCSQAMVALVVAENTAPTIAPSRPAGPSPSKKGRIRVDTKGHPYMSVQGGGAQEMPQMMTKVIPSKPTTVDISTAPHQNHVTATAGIPISKRFYTIVAGSVGTNSRMLVGICSDNFIRFWKLPEGSQLGVYDTSRTVPNSPEFTGDFMVLVDYDEVADCIAVGYEMGRVKLWTLNKEALGSHQLRSSSSTQANNLLECTAQWTAHLSRVSAGENPYFYQNVSA